jgi:DNA/RNA-binding domain of Phe-tRNA-synthetase-like protein
MAVFGVAPGFNRASIRLRGADAGANATAARALIRGVGEARRSRVGTSQETRCSAASEAWRSAYAGLGLEGVNPPFESLLAWAATDAGIPSQSPLADLVNAFSLQHCTPAAAYALAAVRGDLWLRPSRGLERYTPLDGEPAAPPIGELILVDTADTVLARHWHGAPGREAFPGSDVPDAIVHLDRLDGEPSLTRDLAGQLARMVTAYLGGEAEARLLTAARPQLDWGAAA